MKWISKLLFRLVEVGRNHYEYNEYPDCNSDYHNQKVSASRPRMAFANDDDYNNPLNVTIYPAANGKIVKFFSYNEDKHQNIQTLYLIQDHENFDECFRKYMAMEQLKHV